MLAKKESVVNKKQTTKQKGDLLEEIVEQLCSNFKNSKVSRNVKIKGISGVERQIDVLIQANQNSFDIRIIIEAKNYSDKVGIEKIEALKTKLSDVGGNLGVMVCPLGFTDGAIKSAELHNIQLFQIFDHKLGNTTQFIPLRYIVPVIIKYSFSIEGRSSGGGNFELPTDINKWRINFKNKIYNKEELLIYAWNSDMIPQKEGNWVADFGVVKISSEDSIDKFYYLELKINIRVGAEYYLKLFPDSFMKNVKSGAGNHQLFIDAYSKKEDMIKNGWKFFETSSEMEKEALIHDTSQDVKYLTATAEYSMNV